MRLKAEMANTEGNTVWAPRRHGVYPKHACIGRLVIVALSAQPPGVNEVCVCVCVYSEP